MRARGNVGDVQTMMEDTDLVEAIFDSGGLSVVFQPIFEITQRGVRLHPLESLSRGPKGTTRLQKARAR